MNFQFRVDRTFADVSGVIPDWKEIKKCHVAFMFEHPETPKKVRHLHGYLLGTISAFKTFQGNVKTTFSLENNDYETSQVCGKERKNIDLSGAWCYGSKWGTIAPVFLKNISPEQVEELNEYARKQWREPHTNDGKSVVKENLYKNHYDIAEKIAHEAMNKVIEGSSMRAVVLVYYETTVKYLHKNRICFDERNIEKLMITAMSSIVGSEPEKAVRSKILSRFQV